MQPSSQDSLLPGANVQPHPQGLLAFQYWKARRPWERGWWTFDLARASTWRHFPFSPGVIGDKFLTNLPLPRIVCLSSPRFLKTRVSRTWERGCWHVTWRPVSWQGWRTRGQMRCLPVGWKLFCHWICDKIVKMHSASSLKPQTNLKRYLFTFIPILSSDFSDFWLILKIWLL